MHELYDLTNENAVVYGTLVCLSSSVLAKLYMSLGWRSQQLGGGKASAAVEQTKEFKFDSRAQLNEVSQLFIYINPFLLTYLLTYSFAANLFRLNMHH